MAVLTDGVPADGGTTRDLRLPLDARAIRELKAGDKVRIFGRVYTGRDRFHKLLHDGGRPPVDLTDGVIYHCGPVMLREGARWVVKAAGPTTSIREEPYMPAIIARYGIRIIVGKGGMGEATRLACAEHGCVYVHAVGGAGALIAATVTGVAGVHFLTEFGAAEAVWELDVAGLTGVVTIDAHGGSLHRQIADASGEALKRLLDSAPRHPQGDTRADPPGGLRNAPAPTHTDDAIEGERPRAPEAPPAALAPEGGPPCE